MHSNFTGASKRTRQVNLSGRNAPNPWAAKSGPSTVSGPESTVAQAQAERLKRQQERDRLNAAKTLQRSWRGHKSRKDNRREWRAQWDSFADSRPSSECLCFQWGDIDEGNHHNYENMIVSIRGAMGPVPMQQEDLVTQLRLFVRFCDLRRANDHLRLLYFGLLLHTALPKSTQLPLDDRLRSLLAKFGYLTTKAISRLRVLLPPEKSAVLVRIDVLGEYLKLIIFLERVVPTEMCSNASTIFQTLSEAALPQLRELEPATIESKDIQKLLAKAVVRLLNADSNNTSNVYLSFATKFLAVPQLEETRDLLVSFAVHVDQQILGSAIVSSLESTDPDQMQVMLQKDKALSTLGYLIYMQRILVGQRGQHDGQPLKPDRRVNALPAISMLLGHCADDIATTMTPPPSTPENASVASTSKFIQEQIYSLQELENVEKVLTSISVCRLPYPDTVRLLTNYALNLIRAFPSRAYDIRLRVFLSPATAGAAGSLNTIKYFWDMSRCTELFRMVSKSPAKALKLLVHRDSSLTRDQNLTTLRDDWRLILFFLELYTLALKVMDDEEFFSDESTTWLPLEDSMQRKGPLPLAEVATMVTFLKNLAFTLYWNTSELCPKSPLEYEERVLSYSQSNGRTGPAIPPKQAPGLTALEGYSLTYLKGLTTGVLRMLHERDSRRQFLPESHWLMTSNVDMQGFIPAVVEEEEKRNEIDDDDNHSDDSADELDDDIVDMGVSMNPTRTGRWGLPRNDVLSSMRRIDRGIEQAKKRMKIASLAPRLEILRNLPFFIPFQTRVTIFRQFVENDQMRRRGGQSAEEWQMMNRMGFGVSRPEMGNERARHGRHSAQVHRHRIFEDAWEQFYEIGEGLKEPMEITFINEHGENEAGIDGGGVTKEFLTSITSEALKPKDNYSLFLENEQRIVYPNPYFRDQLQEQYRLLGMSVAQAREALNTSLAKYEFLGRIVGKCMYESILIDVHFASFFLLKWALTGGTTAASKETHYRPSINDIRDMDPELYRGLLQLKNYTGNVETDFSLNFAVTDQMDIPTAAGRQITHSKTQELMRNGHNIPVTTSNRLTYIDYIVRYRLQLQPQQVTNAFLKGLGQIIQPMWLAMFNQKELQSLVGGDDKELDLADLRAHTHCSGVYERGDDGVDHPTIEIFWKVLKDMDDQDRRKVLKFVTSTPRAPLQGFGHLYPRFCIRDSSDDQTRLPSSSTCANLLKLPRYSTEKVMREKLLYAVNSGAGFDLS